MMGGEPSLRVGGVQMFTALDYPGALAAVVFCQGCPLRCVYCHNPHLLDPGALSGSNWPEVRERLTARAGFLDAIVFSGGEPLIQAGLRDALAEVRSCGFKTGLHTSGVAPERLSSVLDCLDWVGLDIKADAQGYGAVCGVDGVNEKVWRSYDVLVRTGIAHEIRITLWADLVNADAVRTIAGRLDPALSPSLVLQQARDPVSDEAVASPVLEDAVLLEELRSRFSGFSIRSADGSN